MTYTVTVLRFLVELLGAFAIIIGTPYAMLCLGFALGV